MENRQRKFFGTDGIRGVANTAPLDPESLVRLGQAIAYVLLKGKERRQVLIGKDTRLSGYMIESSLAAGINSMGVGVQLVGPIPTPGVAYLTKSMRVDAGVMISASHNPFEDNGIKIFGGDGYKIADELELEIEALVEPGALEKKRAQSGRIGKSKRIDDAVGRYTVQLKNCFPRELSLEGLRVGFDCANGAAYIVAPQTLEELGAEVISRGVNPNGKNINSGFGSLYPDIVKAVVLENNLDLGVALDGDADRAIFVDDKGAIVDGDQVLALCAVDLKEQGLLRKDTVVSTVMSNLGLEKFLTEHGISIVRTKVGDRYVLEKMREIGAQVGGEQSGHTIFSDLSTSGDGILTALMVLSVIARRKKPLSELLSRYQHFPQKLVNVPVSKKPDLVTLERVQNAIEEVEQALGSSGRVLVRYSGTEDVARVMVECETEANCKKYAAKISSAIEKEIGKV